MPGTLRQNINFGFRTLFKSKVFALTAVLTLALGIGATTAMFSVVYAVFEPMPYPIQTLPGVTKAAVMTRTPGRGSSNGTRFTMALRYE